MAQKLINYLRVAPEKYGHDKKTEFISFEEVRQWMVSLHVSDSWHFIFPITDVSSLITAVCVWASVSVNQQSIKKKKKKKEKKTQYSREVSQALHQVSSTLNKLVTSVSGVDELSSFDRVDEQRGSSRGF